MTLEFEERGMRYEMKMVYDALLASQVRSWVQVHPAGFMRSFPPRKVNNIYFDTPDLDTYNDHIESVSLRRKLRFRWYGEDLAVARGQLEVKNKTERSGWKLVQPLDLELDLRCADWASIHAALLAESDGVFHHLLAVARPTLINTYRREYFVSDDEYIRLTLDFDLANYDQWLCARPNLDFRTPHREAMVMELKCDLPHARQLAEVIAAFPQRANAYSKFVTALDAWVGR